MRGSGDREGEGERESDGDSDGVRNRGGDEHWERERE